MQKIYISGTDNNIKELKILFGEKVTYSDSIDDSIDLIIETTNFPLELKLQRIKEISDKCTKVIPILTSSLCVSVSELCAITKYPDKLIAEFRWPSSP